MLVSNVTRGLAAATQDLAGASKGAPLPAHPQCGGSPGMWLHPCAGAAKNMARHAQHRAYALGTLLNTVFPFGRHGPLAAGQRVWHALSAKCSRAACAGSALPLSLLSKALEKHSQCDAQAAVACSSRLSFSVAWQARLAESRVAEARQPIIVSTSGKKRKGAAQKKPQPASGNGKGFG